ncbi:unnamed protein product [Camellia sinensis]
MDSDLWTTRLLAASRRYQSRSGYAAHEGGDVDGDDESRTEFLCPFCAEEFDVVGLCCHVDEAHPVEAKNGGMPSLCKKSGDGFGWPYDSATWNYVCKLRAAQEEIP